MVGADGVINNSNGKCYNHISISFDRSKAVLL